MINGLDLLKMLNGIDIFTGIGGMSIALQEWIRPVAYCEIDPYCQKVLLQRMADGSICTAPLWDDITSFPCHTLSSFVDIIYGGSPCQGFSVAGLAKGLEDERSGLFYEVLRLAKEIKPSFLFLENVPSITSRGGLVVVKEVASLGYDCRWCVISASSVGAPHKRERWFLLAHSHSESNPRLPLRKEEKEPKPKLYPESKEWELWPQNESPLRRVDDGLPFGMDRTKALGNAVVPLQAREAFKYLMGLKYER